MAHERWDDDPQPVDVVTPSTYTGVPAGPVRQAALVDLNGRLLGWVWTDGMQGAGWKEDQEHPSADAVRAGTYVWGMLRHCHNAGVPAAEVLDPELYEPDYRLMPASTTPSQP